MYRVLKGEMVKRNISVKQLAMEIGITERGLRNKINGITEFTFSETKKIRGIVAEGMRLEELFENDQKSA